MKPREFSRMDKGEEEDEEEEEEEDEEKRSEEEHASSEASTEHSDKETDVEVLKENTDNSMTEVGSDSSEVKPKSIMDTLNEYLESIFSTEEEHDEEIEEELAAMYCLLWRILSATVGIIAIVVTVTKYPQYLNTLHENKLWFSNIKEVEREISFRTEQGLYYSYYKQLVKPPTWIEGYHLLLQDNVTEHGRTINIIHRFNILPEMVISLLYRWLSPETAPSIFYVSSVFYLHGVYGATLYITAWLLSDSVLAGMITVTLFIIHRVDATRVNYAIPLRESFAVPLLFLQLLFTCTYIRSENWQKLKLGTITLLTVTFLLSWQFAPFVLLCQLFCLMTLSRFLLMPSLKVSVMVVLMGFSLVVTCIVQSSPPLLVSSPALSMVVPAFVISATPSDGSLGAFLRLTIATAELSLVLLATILISGAIKIFMNIDADSHVYQLLLAKFQMGDPRDFDSQLYMCTEAFDYMDLETVSRLSESGLLPIYGIGILIYCVSTLRMFLSNASLVVENSETEKFFKSIHEKDFESSNMTSEMFFYNQYVEDRTKIMDQDTEDFSNMTLEEDSNSGYVRSKDTATPGAQSDCGTSSYSLTQQIIQSRPDLVFYVAMSVMWTALAALILRLKVLWMPTVCIIAGVVMADSRVCVALTQLPGFRAIRFPHWFPGGLKIVIASGYLVYLTHTYWGQLSSEIWPQEVYEFWDPDTVDLMEWIQVHTPSTAVFAGSMQLLAGVKLCTGRHITNHPHYEDSWLRHRTHEVYKIYGCESPETVYNILKSIGATYIILEDSICLAPPDPKHPQCRLVDIVDLHSGHLPEEGVKSMPGLQMPQHRRFCDVIRRRTKEYSRFFSLVMSNKTFRVYNLTGT